MIANVMEIGDKLARYSVRGDNMETIQQLSRCQVLLEQALNVAKGETDNSNADFQRELFGIIENTDRALRCVRYAKRLAEANPIPCDCCCHFGGFEYGEVCKQPCNYCDCVE